MEILSRWKKKQLNISGPELKDRLEIRRIFMHCFPSHPLAS